MRNKTKVIIFLSIILTLFILSVVIYLVLFSTEKYICTIKNINGNDIIAELLEAQNNETINDSDLLTKKQYTFSIENVSVKNEEGKKIDKTELKVGDVICITKEKERIKVDLAYRVEPLHRIKSIKLLKTN